MCACYVPLALLPFPVPVRVRRTKKEDSHMQLGSHARTHAHSLARLKSTAVVVGRSVVRMHAAWATETCFAFRERSYSGTLRLGTRNGPCFKSSKLHSFF